VANVNWTVHGRLLVSESMTTRTLEEKPLQNVLVKIYGATVKGAWNFWVETRTDGEGNFSISKLRSDKSHYIKITASFDDNDVSIFYHNVAVTYEEFTVFQSGSKIDEHDVDAREMIFVNGSALDLGKTRGIRTATVWHVIKTTIETLVEKDQRFALKKQFHIILHNYSGALGWTHGRQIDLGSDSFLLKVILHEFMHMWNYDHNKGTSNWPVAACAGFSTHNHREFRNIAFHEGFAEFAAQKLMENIWGFPVQMPRSRRFLFTQNIRSLDALERNDDGVTHGLGLVTAQNPATLLLGGSGDASFGTIAKTNPHPNRRCPPCRYLLDFWDVLTTFLPNEDVGVDEFWNVTKNANGLLVFLERASSMFPKFDEGALDAVKQLLDPMGKVEPFEVCQNFGSYTLLTGSHILDHGIKTTASD